MEAPPVDQVLERSGLDDLLTALVARGYALVGPTVRDGAVVYEEIDGVADLPLGVTDAQEGATYRIATEAPHADGRLFAHNVGPNSFKNQLFPPRLPLWRARRGEDGGLEVREPAAEPVRRAFIGVRSCDLHAIAVQDRVFTGGAHVEPDYAARREHCFIVAVQCAQSAATCFCASMETGPLADAGFDLALTELRDDDAGHRFAVQVGSPAGAQLLRTLPTRAATAEERGAPARVTAQAAGQQTRRLETDGIKELLYDNLEHPRWDEVADRCLSCGNCTLVCPTCFCSTVEDHTDLAGSEAEHVRQWDSCFSLDHSRLQAGSVRGTTRSRYRQWMTHKLATWIDQFGTSGCVGCGRCITWCPVAIDITEETAAIRAGDAHA